MLPQLDAWVEDHEAAEAAKRAAAQAAMAEDGWTVVTRTKVCHTGIQCSTSQQGTAPQPFYLILLPHSLCLVKYCSACMSVSAISLKSPRQPLNKP
jgi:hypothetical protein